MPQEPMLSPAPFALSGSTLRLVGRDAMAFAQAQFANDVARLEDGQWQWNMWLSAKGRVIALFALLRIGPEEWLLWLPDFPAAVLAEQLLRFRFRSKVQIEAMPGFCAHGLFDAPRALGLEAHGSHAGIVRDEAGQISRIALDMSGQTARTLLLQAGEAAPQHTAETCSEAAARWRLEDIAHGLPRLEEVHVETFTPQMLGLEHLNAFSVKKGCYPGQEIVARTHFLGQAKRTTVRLALSKQAAPGLRLASPQGSMLELLCMAHVDARIEALAIASVETGELPFKSEDGLIQAHVLPRLEGLART